MTRVYGHNSQRGKLAVEKPVLYQLVAPAYHLHFQNSLLISPYLLVRNQELLIPNTLFWIVHVIQNHADEGNSSENGKDEINIVDFQYNCYRCGHLNTLPLDAPDAPDYNHVDLTCGNCGDGTRVLLASCPNPECSQYVYWINDISIPDVVVGFAKYMVHNMQTMIDKAALQGAEISMDTPDKYPINASCPCGTDFSVDITIPDLD